VFYGVVQNRKNIEMRGFNPTSALSEKMKVENLIGVTATRVLTSKRV
jgi:hypothetical protein